MIREWYLVGMLLAAGAVSAQTPEPWQTLEPGLELIQYDSRSARPAASGDLVVVRVDPARWDLKILAGEEENGAGGRDLWSWCNDYGLVAAINAGMFQADHRTHVGYARIDGQVANKAANDYLSALALGPVDPEDPPFRIFDLDEVKLGEVAARYRTVVQNLRLIKRPGENRWQPGRDNWREAALAEDWKGRCLLIYCHRQLTMFEFNELLLSLPLGIVAAQHLEGGAPAKLWLDHELVVLENLPGGNKPGPVLPNILGVAPRHPQGSERQDQIEN
jgi:hypothetical protein